jgi:hypothetical protein
MLLLPLLIYPAITMSPLFGMMTVVLREVPLGPAVCPVIPSFETPARFAANADPKRSRVPAY